MIYTLRVMIYRLAADDIPSLRLGSTCNHTFARFIWYDNSIQWLRANYLSLYLSKCEHSPPPNHSRNERQAQLDVHFSLIWRFRLQKTSHRDVFCGATQRATLVGNPEAVVQVPPAEGGNQKKRQPVWSVFLRTVLIIHYLQTENDRGCFYILCHFFLTSTAFVSTNANIQFGGMASIASSTM